MSQILKFKEGGSNPSSNSNQSSQNKTSKKYGKFTIDNTTYDVDDNFINQMYNYGRTLDSDVAYQFGNIINAVKQGKDVSYDSSTDTISGDVTFDLKNDRQQEIMKERKRGHGKTKDAKLAIHSLKDFHYSTPSEPIYSFDWAAPIYAEYLRDDSGNYKLDEKGNKIFVGGKSLAIIDRLNNLSKLLNSKDTDIFKGANGLTKQDYINLYNQLGGEEGIKNVVKSIKEGSWDDKTAALLDDYNLFLNDSSSTSEDVKEKQKINKDKERFSKLGLNYDTVSPYVTIDENNNITLTDKFNDLNYGDGNVMFGDDWKSTSLFNPNTGWLYGFTKLGNRLYKTSDMNDPNSELYKYTENWRKLNSEDKFEEANKLIRWNFSGNPMNFNKFDSKSAFSPFLSSIGPSGSYRSLNGMYMMGNDGNKYQIVEYWDDQNRDMLGMPSYKYALIDQNGNKISDLTKDEITKNLSWNNNGNVVNYAYNKYGQQQALNLKKLINNPEDKIYNGRYTKDIGDKIRLFINPNDENDVIMSMPSLFDKESEMRGKNFRLPKELAIAFRKNPQIWEAVLSDPDKRDDFLSTLNKFVSTTSEDAFTSFINYLNKTSLIGYPLKLWWEPGTSFDSDDYEELGLSEDEAKNLEDSMSKYQSGTGKSAFNRRMQWLVNPYVEPQQEIPMHQNGGVIGTTVKDNTKEEKVTPKSEYRESSEVAGAKNNWTFTSADKLQLASIAGDVAALIAAIPTGGNPLAGAIGAGSSLAQLGADISRDGFDWGDIGSLAVNLGLDAITLLPGVGGVAKLSKMTKVIKGSAKLLKKALLLTGSMNAVNALGKITSGNGDLNDWKALSTGLFAIKGIKNDAQKILATKYKANTTKTPVKAKTKQELKEQFIDEAIKNKPELTKHNGVTNGWYDEAAQKVISYAEAEAGIGKLIGLNKLVEAKLSAQAMADKVKTTTNNLFSNKYNPFSSEFMFNMNNRELKNIGRIKSAGKAPGLWDTYNLRTIGRLSREYPHIAQQLREAGVFAPHLMTWNSPYFGNVLYRSPSFENIHKHKNGGKIVKAKYGLPSDVTSKWNVNTTNNDSNLIPNQQEFYFKTGIKPITYSKTFNPDLKPIAFNNQQNDSIVKNNEQIENIKIKKQNPILSPEDPKVKKVENDLLKTVFIRDKNNTKKKDDQVGAGENKNKFINNPDHLLGIADYFVSKSTINKMADKQADAIKNGMIGSQKQYISLYRPVFDDYGLARIRDMRLNNLRQVKPLSSDPKIVMIENLAKGQQKDTAIKEYHTDFSNVYSKYQGGLEEINNKESLMNSQIHNDRNNSWYNGKAQLDLNEAQRSGQLAQNIKEGIYQGRGNIARDQAEKEKALALRDQVIAENNFKNDIAKKYQSAWNALSSEEQKKYGDMYNYAAQINPTDYNNIWKTHMVNIPINKYNQGLAHSLWRDPLEEYSDKSFEPIKQEQTIISVRKKGGKIRDVSEQHYLDQQKAINKAVNNLNRDIMKLFLKMMS